MGISVVSTFWLPAKLPWIHLAKLFCNKACRHSSVSGTAKYRYPVSGCVCGFGVKKQYLKWRQRFGGYRHGVGNSNLRSPGKLQIRKEPRMEAVLPFWSHISPPTWILTLQQPEFYPTSFLPTQLSLLDYLSLTCSEPWLKAQPSDILHPPTSEDTNPDCPWSPDPILALRGPFIGLKTACQWKVSEGRKLYNFSTWLCLKEVLFCPSRSKWPVAPFLSPASRLLSSEFGTEGPLSTLSLNLLLWLFS